MQGVVDVQRTHARAQAAGGDELCERNQQDRGIEPAAQGDTQSRRRFNRGRRQRGPEGREVRGKAGQREHRCFPVSRALAQRGAAQLAAR